MLADSLYLENINEYVQDNDKIVTYKWLSRKLDVPVNAAKQMLYSYVSHYRDNKVDGRAPMTVTYVVSGLIGDKEHQVHLIPEDELEATKQQLGRILGVHVYSVQKNEVKETETLYTANQDVSKKHLHEYSKWSPIECPCPPQVIKASSEMNTPASEECATGREREECVEQAKPTTAHSEVKSKSSLKNENTETKPEKKTQLQPKKPSSKKRPAEKGTVSSMFAKQAHSGKKIKQESPTSPKKESLASSKKETKTTLVHLVSPKKSPTKSPRKQARSSSKSTKLSIPVGNSKSFKGLGDSDIEDDESEEEGQSSSTKDSHATTETKKNNSSKCKRVPPAKESVKSPVKEVKQSVTTKKRKRKRVQDLSSDEEENTTPVVKKPSKERDSTHRGTGGTSGGSKRRRVKKMVRKMYVNEEGEMVTERVYESASTDVSGEEEDIKRKEDSDREDPPADTVIKEEKPKQSFKAGTKQSSLRSFFK